MRDKIIVTTNYQSVLVPTDLLELTNRTESSYNKIQVNHFDVKQSIVRMDYSDKNKYKNQILNNNKDDSEDGDTDESVNSQHLDNLMSDKIVDHEDQIMLTKESYESTRVSMNESTNIDNPTPSLFLQCLYKLQGLSVQYLFCVYILSMKTHLMLYTYYHQHGCLYTCLYVKTFYIISTNSLRLCSY